MISKNTHFFNSDKILFERALQKMHQIPIDQQREAPDSWEAQRYETTLNSSCGLKGPGTYKKSRQSTLILEPSDSPGWWFDRTDIEQQLPIRVSTRNVWDTQRNITLKSGFPNNYVRMVEHIISQRLGMGLDNLVIKMENGDPPLFNVGSMPIVEAINKVGIRENKKRPLTYWTVKNPIVIMNKKQDGFLFLEPEMKKPGLLSCDCAIDFPNVIGQQRILFDLTKQIYEYGAQARTNCSLETVIFVKTVGKLFSDFRNLGYNWKNILIAGKKSYWNTPALLCNQKSLEAVWHRACLDLIAALSLQETGRLCGKITSYKAGHALDVELMTLLLRHDLLIPYQF